MCDHNLVDVWEDGNRAPVVSEVTKDEAQEWMKPGRYIMCSVDGVEVE